MKVIVTGCAGLLGSNFCEYLLENVKDIHIIGIDNLSGGYIENVPKEVEFVKADLSERDDQEKLKKLFQVDYIFHFAAYAAEGLSPFIRQFNYTNNVLSTAFLINCGIEYNVKRFVFTSSMAVYGENQVPYDESIIPKPIDPYGIAKYACEMDLQVAQTQHGMEFCIIRPHNIYGKYQNIWDPYRNVLGIWMYKAIHNQPYSIYGDGEQTRAFSYVDDVLPCLWKAAIDDRAKNQIINVGGIKEYSLNVAVEYISEITDKHEREYLEKRHEVKHAWCSYQKSIDLLDYNEKVTFKDGLERMWKWVKGSEDRPRKFWSNYEIDKNIYSFWKIKSNN